MNKVQEIAKHLSMFNNKTLTKSQWEIVLKGCGCPKSAFFWKAIRESNLIKYNKAYTLIDINDDSFNIIWNNYCTENRASVKKSYDKQKAYNKARERVNSFTGICFYSINGVLTTEKPNTNENY